MTRGGKNSGTGYSLAELIHELRTSEQWLENDKLKKIVSHRTTIVPYLENILNETLASNYHASQPVANQPRGYAVLHALFILAHLRAQTALPIVLEFLAQKPDFLDCYLHDSLVDEIWEVVFALGVNQIDALEMFVLNADNNALSRLAVCTALVQMCLHHASRRRRVTQVFKKLLTLKKDDADFIGLLISELMDLKSVALRPFMMAALGKNEVWSGIITSEDINRCFKNRRVRKLTPTALFERYKLYTHFAQITPVKTLQKAKRRNVEKSW